MLLAILEWAQHGAENLNFNDWFWPDHEVHTKQKLLVWDEAMEQPHWIPRGSTGARTSTTFRVEALEWLMAAHKGIRKELTNHFHQTPVVPWDRIHSYM